MDYEAVIGLEVHVQLLTKSKIFCGCSTTFGGPANTNVCPVCLGLPGALPVLNREAVTMAIRAGLALGCRINPQSIFARKNYFYPDLPKGYQISMYEQPLAQAGRIEVRTGERSEVGNIVNRKRKTFRIDRVHMEEDAGKLIHDGSHDGSGRSWVDFNRSGVPLLEIVSEPDFRSSQEAYDYMSHLRKTVIYLGVCDGNLEEGSMRCDANVSVRPRGADKLGTKIEVKNLNSLRFLQKAIDYEIQRQIKVISEGGTLTQETRLWDEERSSTFAMRSKEEAHDYRYFPEPDLRPLEINEAWLAEVQSSMPELPDTKYARFVSEYGLGEGDATLLSASPDWADYYEATVAECRNAKAAANWMITELTSELKNAGKTIAECSVTPPRLGELIRLIDTGEISGKIAKSLFPEMFSTGATAPVILCRKGVSQISDEGELSRVIEEIVGAHPAQVESFRAGKSKLFGFFVGEVMKRTKGQANPQKVNELLKNSLEKF
ncbi:MAG: Asp-tRNA(Asn)/Glu-tRNA(Gln) amidotransferase subunit GatB [Acidobacteria bacterium]|nr:Asp-tRNA(Asn)/Glu-tRNA(Gln) amidotransferase subunit GatB [Acidobacteriota bacterium]MBI3655700.1 Asp-tRNA(Asn)/Glu-tRNA(Gln) amidotransferase subunit GatB [Acidobacteriota bacterium]